MRVFFSKKLYLKSEYVQYGNIGCGFLSLEIKRLDLFFAKNEQVKRKFLYLLKWRDFTKKFRQQSFAVF